MKYLLIIAATAALFLSCETIEVEPVEPVQIDDVRSSEDKERGITIDTAKDS